MSDLLMLQVVELINKVATDVRRMGDITTEQTEQLVSAMDNMAAGFMAMQAITAAQLKTAPVERDAVQAWLTKHMDPDGEGTDKARAIADLILQDAAGS